MNSVKEEKRRNIMLNGAHVKYEIKICAHTYSSDLTVAVGIDIRTSMALRLIKANSFTVKLTTAVSASTSLLRQE